MAELTYAALDGFSGALDSVQIIMGAYDDMTPIYEDGTSLWNCAIDVKVTYRV